MWINDAMLIDTPLMMLYCFLGTMAVEGVLAFLCGVRKKSDQLIILLVNVMTNPLMVSIESVVMLEFFWQWQLTVAAVAMEIAVFFAESLIYKAFLTDIKKPFFLSLFINAGSFMIVLGINLIME